MLVLSRKKDEKLIIGDNVTVTIIEIRGDSVRFGIQAPREISVHRQEFLIKKDTEKSLEESVEKENIPKTITFQDYLKNKEYMQAYNILKKGNYNPTYEEYKELTVGLGGLLEGK